MSSIDKEFIDDFNVRASGEQYITSRDFKDQHFKSYPDIECNDQQRFKKFIEGMAIAVQTEAEELYKNQYEDNTRGQVELHKYYIENESELIKNAKKEFNNRFIKLKTYDETLFTVLRTKFIDEFISQFNPAYLKDSKINDKYTS